MSECAVDGCELLIAEHWQADGSWTPHPPMPKAAPPPAAPDLTPEWGGIPPDPDQVVLMKCSRPGCGATADQQPLVVVAFLGKMMVLCRTDLEEAPR